jgi:hypothetical protein
MGYEYTTKLAGMDEYLETPMGGGGCSCSGMGAATPMASARHIITDVSFTFPSGSGVMEMWVRDGNMTQRNDSFPESAFTTVRVNSGNTISVRHVGTSSRLVFRARMKQPINQRTNTFTFCTTTQEIAAGGPIKPRPDASVFGCQELEAVHYSQLGF